MSRLASRSACRWSFLFLLLAFRSALRSHFRVFFSFFFSFLAAFFAAFCDFWTSVHWARSCLSSFRWPASPAWRPADLPSAALISALTRLYSALDTGWPDWTQLQTACLTMGSWASLSSSQSGSEPTELSDPDEDEDESLEAELREGDRCARPSACGPPA